jgi:hypothetical protein
MPAAPTDTDGLLAELRNRMVVHESYSRRSLLGRAAPAMLTAMLALVAIVGGVLLCELTAPRTS